MPRRIQLSRKKGWRKPEGAIVVSRPTKLGNLWRVVPVRPSGPFDVEHDVYGFVGQSTGIEGARAIAVRRYRDEILAVLRDEPQRLEGLRGHDLACWCPLDQPCHADVLLELANA